MIKFPKMSVAASVTNRILNIWDEVGVDAPQMPQPQPNVPDPSFAGEALDAELASMQPAQADSAAVAEGAATGRSPLNSLLDPDG